LENGLRTDFFVFVSALQSVPSFHSGIVAKKTPMEMIADVAPIEVEDTVAMCDGGMCHSIAFSHYRIITEFAAVLSVFFISRQCPIGSPDGVYSGTALLSKVTSVLFVRLTVCLLLSVESQEAQHTRNLQVLRPALRDEEGLLPGTSLNQTPLK
jgi:hypothetical protein